MVRAMVRCPGPTAAVIAACALVAGCGGGDEGTATGDGRAPAGAFFTDVTETLGIDFAIDRSDAGDYFMPDVMGAGCALLDHDGDGDLDLYVVNGFREGPGRWVTAAGANRLFRQEADGRFTDVTAVAGVGHEGYGMGAAVGDVDNDGDADLLVTNYGPDCLYRNDGDGTFTEAALPAQDASDAWSTSAAFADYDGDGLLDVFVTRYLAYDHAIKQTDKAGRPEYAAPAMFEGVPDVLLRNRGDGTFEDRSDAAGLGATPGHGLGVVAADLDGDGRTDFYVANDGEPNFAWINRGDGTFTNEAATLGLATNRHGQSEAGMGIAIGDGDGDGHEDLLVTHLVLQTNTLYRREGGRYVDDTGRSGLGGPSVQYTGFGTEFVDIDHDGDLDLLVVNGRVLRGTPVHRDPRVNAHWQPYAEPNLVFLNDGAGRFTAVGDGAGPFAIDLEASRGLATGDLDADGDRDVVVTNGNGTVRVYRNDAAVGPGGDAAGAWLLVRAVDPALRRDAIGAVVRVRVGSRWHRRDVRAAASYLSSSDPRAHFGLADATAVDEIVVEWPDGTRESFGGGAVDRVVEVRKGQGV
jgi:hypothetical protein